MFNLTRYLLAALLAALLAGPILLFADFGLASGLDTAPRLTARWADALVWGGRLAAALAGGGAAVTILRTRDGLGLLRRTMGVLGWLAALLLVGGVVALLAVLTTKSTPSADMPAADIAPLGFALTALGLGGLVLGLAALLLAVGWIWRRRVTHQQKPARPI